MNSPGNGGSKPTTGAGTSIASALSEAAATHHGRIALPARAEPLRFAELHDRGLQTAARLSQAGFAPGETVGLLSSNNDDAVIAMTGLIYAGCSIAFLDPSHPDRRLEAMLNLSGAAGAVACDANWHRLAEVAPELRHAEPLGSLVKPGATTGTTTAAATNAAETSVVTFTSGSTGVPKGVIESHADSLTRYRLWADGLGVRAGDRVATVAHLGGCRMEIFGALLQGAGVCIYDTRRNGIAALPEWLAKHQITVLRLFPSMLRTLAQLELADGALGSLRCLYLLGEALWGRDVRTARTLCGPDTRVFNAYASTEVGPCAMLALDTLELPDDAPVPVGTGLPGRHLAVLDDEGNVLGDYARGILHIQGTQLFQGYCQDPDSTSAVLEPAAAGLSFQSGDVASRDAAGLITIHGREDQQTKVAGHRVQLDEVERCLQACANVAMSAVVAQPHELMGNQLIAYVVPEPHTRLQRGPLRTELARFLPLHMLPRRFVFLADPPLTLNGKLDRNALTPPAAVASPVTETPGATESVIASVWSELLESDAFTLDDDFFDVGGTSLLAALAAMQIERALSAPVPLSLFGSQGTVRTMAAALDRHDAPRQEPCVVSLNSAGTAGPLICVGGIRGHTLRLLQLARDLPDDVPVHTLQPPGLDWSASRLTQLDEFSRYYLQELRQAAPRGPYRLLGPSFGGAIVFEMALQLEAAGEHVEWVCLLDSALPILSGITEPDLIGDQDDRTALARTHLTALYDYRPERPLRAPLHLLLCTGRLIRPVDKRDWSALVAGPFTVGLVPGVHGAFHTQPQRPVVASTLKTMLAGDFGQVMRLPPESVFFDAELRDDEVVCFNRSWPLTAADADAAGTHTVTRREHLVRVSGWCRYPVGGSPGHILVAGLDDRRLHGWFPPMGTRYRTEGESTERGEFWIDLPRTLFDTGLRMLALDPLRRVALSFPVT